MSRKSKARKQSKPATEGRPGPEAAPSSPGAAKVAAPHPGRPWLVPGICAGLVAMVFAVFGQTLGFGFVNFDDSSYIYENPVVLKGLSWAGLGWAFTYEGIGHWHPLTWLTHMLDCNLYGTWAGGHHLTNVILHAAAVALLFLVLYRMTGAIWRCAFVAAAWAIHPLRAESVAWIAERKDVLSAFFFMVTLGAYLRYVRKPSTGRYMLGLVSFALGLLSKDMLVTLPCVLLLLDWWPLGRMKQRSAIQPLVKEKIPLFILSIVSAIITVRAPETMSSPDRLPVWLRLENALVSCCIYFRQTFWPVELAAVYPNPTHGFPIWELAGCATLLGAITAAAYRWRSRQPALLIGWLWFLGMLAPVIGLTQISYYSHADRYTYLPQIGLLIGIAWVAADWAGDVRLRRMALGAVAVVILCILPVAAAQQTGYWHDSDALWAHTLACTRDNSVALNSVGLTRMRQGRLEEAITKFRAAIQINPDYAEAHDNLGYTLSQMGRTAEAMSEYNEALRIAPAYSVAHSNLGNALVVQGHAEDAMAEFQEALQLDPTNGAAANGLGDVLLRQGHAEEAAAQFREAVQYSPTDPLIEVNLARALLLEGQIENAVTEMRKALQLAQGQKNATLASSLAHELSLYEAALQPAGH